MHHRIYISSVGGSTESLVYSISDYTTFNEFVGKAIYIGFEWITPIAGSDFIQNFKFDIRHPNGIMLVLNNIKSHNQATSWNGIGSILALLPGYVGTGYYGVSQDAPYLQSSALPIISRGDDLRTRSTLEFVFLST